MLYLHAYQVRVTTGDSGLCRCTCVTYFERQLTPLCVHSNEITIIKSHNTSYVVRRFFFVFFKHTNKQLTAIILLLHFLQC